MVVLVRYALLAVSLALAAVLLVCSGLAARTFLVTPSARAALAAALFLICAVPCLLLAARIHRFRDPAREASLASGLLVGVLTSLVCLAFLEFTLARLRPAITYDRAVHLSPPVLRPSAVLPFELRPGYHAPTYVRETGATIDLRVNPQGHRGPPFSIAKPTGTYRILVLGDSFAINLAIPEDALYTVVLQRMLRESGSARCPVEVINAGWADGYSPDAYVAYMLNHGFDLAPDLVIMQYFVLNDFKDLLENEVLESRDGMPVRVRSKYRYVDDLGRLRRSTMWKYELPVLRNSHLFIHLWDVLRLDGLNSALVPILVPNFAGDNFLPNAYGIRTQDVYAEATERPPVLQDAFERSMDYVRRLDREARRRGVDLLLFVVPDGAQTSRETWRQFFSSPPPGNWDHPNPQAQIHAALASDGVSIFDPLALYRARAEREALFLGDDRNGHWNEAGNAFSAQILFEHLTRRHEPFRDACVAKAEEAEGAGGHEAPVSPRGDRAVRVDRAPSS